MISETARRVQPWYRDRGVQASVALTVGVWGFNEFWADSAKDQLSGLLAAAPVLAAVLVQRASRVLIATGVALAAFYALRLYQRTMHNRLPDGVESREISLRDGVVLAPLVACIVALALWPGVILDRGEASVDQNVGAVTALATDCGTHSNATVEPSEASVSARLPVRAWIC